MPIRGDLSLHDVEVVRISIQLNAERELKSITHIHCGL